MRVASPSLTIGDVLLSGRRRFLLSPCGARTWRTLCTGLRLAWLCGLVTLAAAQQEATFRSSVSLVRVEAQVAAGGRVIENLTAADFLVRDNDQVQAIRYLSRAEEPLDVLLLLDFSGSMSRSLGRLAAVCREALAVLRPDDRVAVMAFDRNTRLALPWTSDRAAVAGTIARLLGEPRLKPGTDVHGAIEGAARYFAKDRPAQRGRAILIVTDNLAPATRNERTLLGALWEADAVLAGLVVEAPAALRRGAWFSRFVRPVHLSRLAEESGGELLEVPEDPGPGFRALLDRLRQRYTLYYDAPAAAAGALRSVRIDLAPAARARYPDAVVRARKGYLAKGARLPATRELPSEARRGTSRGAAAGRYTL